MLKSRAVLVVGALLLVGCGLLGPSDRRTATESYAIPPLVLETMGLELLYRTPAIGEPVVGAHLASSHILLETVGNKLYAIKREDGFSAWVAALPGRCTFRPGKDEESYYVVCGDQLLTLDKARGGVLARRKLGFAASSSPAADNIHIYLGSQDGRLRALPKGETFGWQFTPSGMVVATPVVQRDSVYCACTDGKVYRLNATNGKERWSFATADPVKADMAVVADTVLVASTDHKLYALHTGLQLNRRYQQKWLIPYIIQGMALEPLLVIDETVYVHGEGSGIHAVNIETGQAKWVYPRGKQFVAQSHAGTYLLTTDKMLALLDTDTGAQKGELNIQHWMRCLANPDTEVVYLVDRLGSVTAYKSR